MKESSCQGGRNKEAVSKSPITPLRPSATTLGGLPRRGEGYMEPAFWNSLCYIFERNGARFVSPPRHCLPTLQTARGDASTASGSHPPAARPTKPPTATPVHCAVYFHFSSFPPALYSSLPFAPCSPGANTVAISEK